jgi:[ribosomal protein S5]-alanine N-acetyltransferase
MHKVVETERLYMRPFVLGDEDILLALNANPEVVRYTGDGPFRDLAHVHEVLTRVILPQYAWGMGRWAVHLKADDAFIGWCGLKKHPDGQIDLGYRFFVEYWGKGYATESAKAVMDYGDKSYCRSRKYSIHTCAAKIGYAALWHRLPIWCPYRHFSQAKPFFNRNIR